MYPLVAVEADEEFAHNTQHQQLHGFKNFLFIKDYVFSYNGWQIFKMYTRGRL